MKPPKTRRELLRHLRAWMDRRCPGWRTTMPRAFDGRPIGRIDLDFTLPTGETVTVTVWRRGGFEGEQLPSAAGSIEEPTAAEFFAGRPERCPNGCGLLKWLGMADRPCRVCMTKAARRK